MRRENLPYFFISKNFEEYKDLKRKQEEFSIKEN